LSKIPLPSSLPFPKKGKGTAKEGGKKEARCLSRILRVVQKGVAVLTSMM